MAEIKTADKTEQSRGECIKYLSQGHNRMTQIDFRLRPY